MSFTTTHNQFPLIAPAQAQKHVTHNEALLMIDTVVHLAVLGRTLSAPPSTPNDGDRYLIPASASDDWTGKSGQIAVWQSAHWLFHTPKSGWVCWVEAESTFLVFNGTEWVAINETLSGQMSQLGVNATPDATNRLAVASDAVLMNNAGDDIRVKLNKDAANDTASFLFQSAWTGYAEIGLTGDNDFHFKVSPNGSSWTEALTLRADGRAADFSGSLGVGRLVPSDFWSSVEEAVFAPQGFFGTNGAFELGLWWNGHRNNAGGWTSLGLNGYSSGAGLTLGHSGIKFKWQDPPSGLMPVDIFQMTNAAFYPAADNARSLGTATRRWNQIYAASGTISTSDARTKTVVRGGSAKRASEKRAATRIRGLITRYQFKDAISRKGPRTARFHFGIIAQDVEEALRDEGLKPEQYGFLCKDKIDDDVVYGIRYEELIMFLMCYGV